MFDLRKKMAVLLSIVMIVMSYSMAPQTVFAEGSVGVEESNIVISSETEEVLGDTDEILEEVATEEISLVQPSLAIAEIVPFFLGESIEVNSAIELQAKIDEVATTAGAGSVRLLLTDAFFTD